MWRWASRDPGVLPRPAASSRSSHSSPGIPAPPARPVCGERLDPGLWAELAPRASNSPVGALDTAPGQPVAVRLLLGEDTGAAETQGAAGQGCPGSVLTQGGAAGALRGLPPLLWAEGCLLLLLGSNLSPVLSLCSPCLSPQPYSARLSLQCHQLKMHSLRQAQPPAAAQLQPDSGGASDQASLVHLLVWRRHRNEITQLVGKIDTERGSFKWHFQASFCGRLMPSDIITCKRLIMLFQKRLPATR